jgi:A/G-specific adenine glycosylase
MPSSKPSRRRLGREALRTWYAPRRGAYPWRRTLDPFAIWVSEVMLQQTQAARIVPAYASFLRRFPTVRSLAAAPRRDVVAAWGGLGYNRRAFRLSEAARAIVRDHGGRIPRDKDELLELPGVGPYTAAAVASMGFGAPVAVVDTNVRRVISRVHLGMEGHEVPAKEVWALADAWLDRDDPATWNQALMDLGREVCGPKPHCDVCPLHGVCRFRLSGATPRRGPRRQGPFEGSSRQVRGAVVKALRSNPSLTHARLAVETGFARDRVDAAVETLVVDRLVEVGAGRVRLAGS